MLWRDLDVTSVVRVTDTSGPGPLDSLLSFLAARPRGVQRLALRWGWYNAQLHKAAVATMETLAGAAGLTAGTLRCLELEILEDDTDVVQGA